MAGPSSVMPMFPLGCVLVPGAALPLHVFAPRYRQLTVDCLAGEREFGVVLIERGSEVGGGDVRSTVGTVARIVDAVPMGDGRWALGAVGVRRIRVRRWLEDDPYPRAEVEDWPDPPPPTAAAAACGDVIRSLRRVLARHAELGDPAAPATGDFSEDPVLASYQAVALSPLGPADQQRLLTAADVPARLELLARAIADDEEILDARLAWSSGAGPGDVDEAGGGRPAD